MDVKYGITDAFTFDMTLIPDFGQTSFDPSVLNLSPFEIQYSEQRPFFTEGTELFSKGNLFYSRRIGGYPSREVDLKDHERLAEVPAKVKLFNAFKISGRTNKGLGIGFFNGITEKAEAVVYDSISGKQHYKQTVEPWANYNVLVLDQRFRGNSSVSFVNTNVIRSGDFRDANASGILWDINDKKNIWNFFGNVKESVVRDGDTKYGTRIDIGGGKVSGKHRYTAWGNITTKDWNINDLGFSTLTNYANYGTYYGYRILQPSKKFNNFSTQTNFNYFHRLVPFLFTKFEINNNTSFTNKNFESYGTGIETTPFGENDIYEPRTDGRFLKVPGYFDSWLWYESDNRKKLQYNLMVDYYAYNAKGRNLIDASASLRYRFSDKFNVTYQFKPNFSNNEIGYAGKENQDIFMGRRQRTTYENALTSKYTFNQNMALSLAFRHYFSDVTYKQFYVLNQDGSLDSGTSFTKDLNGTYNSWNVDLRYSWWFAPGSQLTLLYRNSVDDYLEVSRLALKDNFNKLFDKPQNNSISLRVTYYLDYNRVKNWF